MQEFYSICFSELGRQGGGSSTARMSSPGASQEANDLPAQYASNATPPRVASGVPTAGISTQDSEVHPSSEANVGHSQLHEQDDQEPASKQEAHGALLSNSREGKHKGVDGSPTIVARAYESESQLEMSPEAPGAIEVPHTLVTGMLSVPDTRTTSESSSASEQPSAGKGCAQYGTGSRSFIPAVWAHACCADTWTRPR
jgi:hypothetical protein